MANEQVIASLVGKVGFQVDSRPLLEFEKLLDRLARKVEELNKKANKLTGAGSKSGDSKASPKAGTGSYKATAAQQALIYNSQKRGLQVAQAQARLDAINSAAALRNASLAAKLQQQARQANLKAAKLQQQFETTKLGTMAKQAQLQAATHRAGLAQIREKQALERAGKPSGGSKPNGIGQGVSGIKTGIAAGSVGGLANAITGLSSAANLAVGAIIAVAGALAGLKSFGDKSVESASKGNMAQSQFNAVEGISPEQAKAARSRMQGLTDDLGINEQSIAPEYTKSVIGLTDGGMKVGESQDFLQGMLSYGKGSNLSGDRMSLILNAVNQAMSKGQLYAEEWRSQISESLPGSNKLGVEVWADVSKSGKRGAEAAKDFSESMQRGEIAGERLVEFLKALGTRLEEEANRGGRLDEAKNSTESIQNRIDNVSNRSLEKAAKENDSELVKSYRRLGESREEFAKRLEFIQRAAAPASANVNDKFALFLDGAGALAEGLGKSILRINERIAKLEAERGAGNWNAVSAEWEKLTGTTEQTFVGTGDFVEQLLSIVSVRADEFNASFMATTFRELNAIMTFFDRAFEILGTFADWLLSVPTSIIDKAVNAINQLSAKMSNIGGMGGVAFGDLQTDSMQRNKPSLNAPESWNEDVSLKRMKNSLPSKMQNDITSTVEIGDIIINGASADPAAIAQSVRDSITGSLQKNIEDVFQSTLSATRTNMLSPH
jgi:tape measure domain-containing protein